MKKIVSLLTFLIFLAPAAQAFTSLETVETNDGFGTALSIPDYGMKWVLFEEVDAGYAKYYEVESEQDVELILRMAVPKTDGMTDFRPAVALIGPGFGIRDPVPFEVPDDMGTVVLRYDGPIPSNDFVDMLTDTHFWYRQRITSNLPEPGAYYIVVFDEHGKGGKYAMFVGDVEDIEDVQSAAAVSSVWFETKEFVEDDTSPIIALALPIIIIVIAAAVFYSAHKSYSKKAARRTKYKYRSARKR